MLRWWLWAALLAASCVQTSTVTCDDGTVCPDTHECVAAGGCWPKLQIDACDGIADGEACASNGVPGRCADGVCMVAVCGNSMVETPEVCDDGNVVNGDGCSGLCNSDETCGNGIAELAEQCDCGDAAHPGETICG